MRITRFEAENFKRLKAVDITPDDNTVVITGRNAQGKTSVLDGIMAALSGRKGAKELVRPIRDGEAKARVVVELDDLVVERKWTPSGSTVIVSPKGGNARLNSPQAVLDKLIGDLSFDPLAFAEADPKSQVETLIDLIGREQFDALTAERKAAYENRTEINRDVKRYRAEVESRADAREIEPVDPAELVDELRLAERKVALLEEHSRLKQQMIDIQARMAEIEIEGKAMPKHRSTGDLNKMLSSARETNEQAQRWIDRKAAEEALARAESVSAKHTALIESVDERKATLIQSANLPVEGLTFDEDGVEYNGVPFVQSSSAERLKVSVGMAMALNPELRVICIRDASLLDKDSKNALVALAKQHDYQIWYEVVGDGGKVGVVIEDGQVSE